MSRIDRYLDGELDGSALSPAERTEADAASRAVEAAREYVQERPAPDLTAAIMRRIEGTRPEPAARRSPLRTVLDAIWTARPVTVQFRPAYALIGAAAVLTVALLLPWHAPQPAVGEVPPGSGGEPQVFVQFRLEATGASDVHLAGTFTDWQPSYRLHESVPGVWTITVPLAPGVHDYAFVVDGDQWVPDPYAPHISDGFGGSNSRLALLPPEVPRT